MGRKGHRERGRETGRTRSLDGLWDDLLDDWFFDLLDRDCSMLDGRLWFRLDGWGCLLCDRERDRNGCWFRFDDGLDGWYWGRVAS